MRDDRLKLSAPRSFLRENATVSPTATPGPRGGGWPSAPLNAGSGGPGAGITQIVVDLSTTPPPGLGLALPSGTGFIYASSYNTTAGPVPSPTDAVTLSLDPSQGRSDPVTVTPGWISNVFPWLQAYLTWVPTSYPTQSIFQIVNSPLPTSNEDSGNQ